MNKIPTPSFVPIAQKEIYYDFSRWIITEFSESPFVKMGRLYIKGDNLITAVHWYLILP